MSAAVIRSALARAGFHRTAIGWRRPASSAPSSSLRRSRPAAALSVRGRGREHVLRAALEALGVKLGDMQAFGVAPRFIVNMTLPAARLALLIEGPAPRDRRWGDVQEAGLRAAGWTAVRIPHRAIDDCAERWRVALDVAMRTCTA
jgi:hypothetical protein